MKRNAKIMGRIAATAMAAAMTVTAIPVNAAAMPAPSDEQEEIVESEKGVGLTEEGDETLEPESGIKDTVAPTLTGLTVSATKVTALGTIELVADATDDISGVSSIQVNLSTDTPAPSDEYRSSDSIGFSTTYFDEELRQTVKYADGKWHGTFDASYMTPGTYKISSIRVSDEAGNQSYYSNDWSLPIPESIKNISIQVDKGNVQFPAVSNVSFEKTTIQPSEKVKVTAKLTGNTSRVERVRFAFFPDKNGAYGINVTLEPNPDGSFSGYMEVPEHQYAGDYKFSYVAFSDGKEDHSYYSDSEKVPETLKNLVIHVKNDHADTTAPVIKSIVLDADKVDAPGHLGFTAKATDDLSGVSYISVGFQNKDTGECISGIEYFGDISLSGSIDIDQYASSGEYQLISINVGDKAGNSTRYIADDAYATPIPDSLKGLKFVVNNDADTTAVITSTISPTLLSDIKNAADNAMINVDISADKVIKKAVLDAVKGTNKTLRLNSDDIQWVIKGSDIKGQTKDLDLTGEISYGITGYESDLYSMLGTYTFVEMTLADNAELPCKAHVRFMPRVYLIDEIGHDNLYVYYYNEADSKLEAVASGISLTKENNLEFDITHCGPYIVTKGPAKFTSLIPDVPNTWEGMTGVDGFVQRCYNFALGRDAEAAGMQDWTNRLQSKTETAAEVGRGFIFSDEFKNKNFSDAQFVEILYRMMFGRKADAEGKSYWLSLLSTGVSREYVYHGFAESQEFSNLCGGFGVERGQVSLGLYRDKNVNATAFIARFYTKMLGRSFDDDGIEYWCEKYLTGKKSIEDIAADGFLHSEELINQKLSNEEFVTRMYETFLNREPEKAGLNDWVNRLETGKETRDTLVFGFTHSQEFAKLKAKYQLP